jgi:hypothetical protein
VPNCRYHRAATQLPPPNCRHQTTAIVVQRSKTRELAIAIRQLPFKKKHRKTTSDARAFQKPIVRS